MTNTSKLWQNQILNKTMSPLEGKPHVFSDGKRPSLFTLGCDMYSNNYDYVMKLILLGDQGVGKSSFTKALKVHPDVKKIACKCRVAQTTDHLELEIVTSSGKTVMIRLCDTGGQERYRSLTSSYYRGAHGALLVFDTKKQKSLENVETWLSDLESFSTTSTCMRVLLGSNCTAQDREVTSQTARKYAENRSLPYLEFDSSQFYNIIESLQLIVETIAKEVTITPNSPEIIKPTETHLDGSQSEDLHRFTCLC